MCLLTVSPNILFFHIIIKENTRLLDGTSAENFHKICFWLCTVFISFIRSWVQSSIKSFFDFSLITSLNLSISLSLVISKKFSLLTLFLTLKPFSTIPFSTESLRSFVTSLLRHFYFHFAFFTTVLPVFILLLLLVIAFPESDELTWLTLTEVFFMISTFSVR